MTTDLLAAALAHAGRGRPVFPCGPDKRPLTPHGFKDASRDPETITSWWREFPAALIGMPTGRASGVFVLDVDVDQSAGKDGEMALGALVNGHGPLPDTVESLTPRGGRHILFRHPGAEVPCSASKLGPDLDVRGDGGYIILPPSRLPDGRTYAWEGSSDPDEGVRAADAPAWLLALVTRSKAKEPPADQGRSTGAPIPEGGRNAALTSLAGTMRRKGMTEAAILAALLADNDARCVPPLPQEEVRAIAASVSRYAPRETATDVPPVDEDPGPQAEDPPVDDMPGGDQETEETPEQAVRRLAGLSALAYETVREDEAKALGVRVSVLDKEVTKARGGGQEEGTGRAIKLYEPTPWDHPVEGSEVLNEALAAVLRHMVMRPEDAAATVLWAAHTFVYDRFSHTPRLLITAPDAECGKTLLMTHMVGNLVNKPQAVELMKAAPFFRLAESHKPTFLIDEMDVFIKEDSDLLAAVNNGFEPHGGVPRCVGDDFEVRLFSTHCPVAMAGIRLIEKLPATTIGRSVVITLDRATHAELSDDACYDSRKHRQHLLDLGRKLCRWMRDNAERLHRADPTLPPGVRNRRADVWRPLFAIAEAAGGGWPEKARAALFSQSSEKEPSKALQLLIDMKEIFGGRDSVITAELLERLAAIEDSVWADYNFRAREPGDRRIKDRQLAGLLKPYGIKPGTVWLGKGSAKDTAKGYKAEDLRKAWARYLPTDPPSHPSGRQDSTTARAGGQSDPSGGNPHMTDRNGTNTNKINGPDGLTDTRGGHREETHTKPVDTPTRGPNGMYRETF